MDALADWETRLFQERADLALRTKTLEVALRGGTGPFPLDDEYCGLLNRQIDLMKRLIAVLDARIDRI